MFDTVLAAIGRTADTDGLNLAAAGVEVEPRTKKLACINEQTNVPHIYGIGDVLEGKPELTPVAIEAGLRLARRLYGDSEVHMDYENVATTVFTPLEYSSIGLTEEDALKELGDSLEVYHTEFTPLEHAILDRSACYAKILVDTRSDTVRGVHYLGPNAGEVIQGWAIAMRGGNLRYSDVLGTVGVHPTCAEVLVTGMVTKRSGDDVGAKGC